MHKSSLTAACLKSVASEDMFLLKNCSESPLFHRWGIIHIKTATKLNEFHKQDALETLTDYKQWFLSLCITMLTAYFHDIITVLRITTMLKLQ